MGQDNEPATKRDLNKLEAKINDVEKRLTAKIDAVDQRLTDVERRLLAKIDANGARIDANTKRLDKLTTAVLNNRELIEQRATREELNQRFDEVVTGIDEVMATLRRWDQERVASSARLDRVESDVKNNTKRIEKIEAK